MKRTLIFLVTSILVASLMVFGSERTQTAAAQGGGTLQYGDVVTGEITETDLEQSYTFVGSADDVVVVIAEPETLNSEIEPRITITGPDGETLVMAESYFTVEAATQLPVEGKYTLTVGRYEGDSGESVGPYRLTFFQPQVLEVGDSVSDTISQSDTHYYSIVGLSTFRLTYIRHSGTFGPEVEVNLLAPSDDLFSFGGLDSVSSIGGASTSEGMLRVEHDDSEAFIITVGTALLDFNFGTTPASYTIEISE